MKKQLKKLNEAAYNLAKASEYLRFTALYMLRERQNGIKGYEKDTYKE